MFTLRNCRPRQPRPPRFSARALVASLLLLPLGSASAAGISSVQSRPPAGAVDPGVRGGPASAGSALPGLTAQEQAFFDTGMGAFHETDGVAEGLGPRFNLDSCVGCHAQPAAGGTSPALNPEVAVASLNGAQNQVPWFVVANGPIREARFKLKPDGTRDGGVTNLFVITGRKDAPGCNIAQPSFLPAGDPLTGQGGNGNLIFRTPTPVFGAGLIESISDQAILANKTANRSAKAELGISGRENRNGNDGTITRFGWKAQNKSLLLFAGEAYNVETGVTNEIFRQEREEDPACQFNPLIEDDGSTFTNDTQATHSDIVKFAAFMRFLAPPTPAPDTRSIAQGRTQFERIGCALCHTPSLTTGKMTSDALSGKKAQLYSDLLLHDMGAGLADDILQGAAGPREFRTAPLWGLGQRLFFHHDGRTSNLVEAIQAHASQGSEANGVIARYGRLANGEKQDLLNFLRSL